MPCLPSLPLPSRPAWSASLPCSAIKEEIMKCVKRNRFGRFGRFGRLRRRGVGRKEKPSIVGLQRPIAILQCTRISSVAGYFRLCALLRQTLNPQILNPKALNPQTLNPQTLNPQTLNPSNPKLLNPQSLNPGPRTLNPKPS